MDIQMSEIVYLNEKDEVFERRVEVGLLLQLHDRVKVLVVDVSVDPEQALQDGLRHGHKVALKRDALEREERDVSQIVYINAEASRFSLTKYISLFEKRAKS